MGGGERLWLGWEQHSTQAWGSGPSPLVIAGWLPAGAAGEGDFKAASLTSELASHPSVLGKGLLFNGAKECVFL